ncbi:MAG: protein kinase [Verrucomicrobiota bacterium]
MNKKGQCAQCGAPLPADIAIAICPQCELRGALNLFAEPSQILSGAGVAAHEPSALSGAAHPVLSQDAGVFSQRRFGDYELLEEIARGGMGIVYRARQVSLGRIVAVKMLLSGRLGTKDFVQRFRTESAAAASLQHPNIVAIHEVGFADGQHFFAMDFVEGLTLGQLVAQGPLPARPAATYLKTVAEAIHFAHERNVLHRDLKPSNVLIDSATDQPRLTDFGLAKRLEAETELTLTGQVLGSPNYMSPEQAVAKRGTVGKRSDVYSLGAILYHLLTGRPPFQGETLTDVLHQVVNDDPLDPHLLAPRVPRDLETICLKCLEKEPARRYQTAHELAHELSRFLRDEPIHSRPISRAEHAWRWCRRKPALASLGATLVLVFTLGFSGTLWQWRQAKQQRQLAEENRQLFDQNLYDSDMRVAQIAWDQGDLGLTLSLLEAHQPRSDEKDRRSFEWFYFWNLCQGDQRMTLKNHSQAVNCVAFSPDAKLLATGSVGNPVQVWDTATGKRLRPLPEQNVVSLAFAPDSQTLGIGGQDQWVVWNLETGRAVFKREERLGRFSLAFLPVGNLVVIGKGDGLRNFASDSGSAELWDYVTGERKHVFAESGRYVAVSRRGDQLVTGNWKETIKIWDLTTGQFVKSLGTGRVIAMALSPDGQTLATSERGSSVELWDITQGQKIGWLTNNQHTVWSLAFSPDGRFLATGGADQMVRLWDVATRQQTEQLQGHGSEVMSLAFSADGQALASGSKDRKAMLWSIHPNRAVTTVSNVISRPIFSPDGRWVAAGIDQGGVALWDAATLQEEALFAGTRDAVAFSADGSALVTRGTNYFLKTFNVGTRVVREAVLRGPATEVDDYAALSPDGQVLAVGWTNGTLTFCEAKTGVVIATTPHAYASNIFQIAFSPNGKLLATTGREIEAGRAPTAKIWDVVTHKMVTLLAGHTDVVLSVGFSPDGKILGTCGVDNSIKFWDTTTWKEIPPSLGQKEPVISLTFSPNGRTLATVCSDGTMKLWNVATRRELASLKFGLYARCIAFSPDGQTLAAWNPSGLLRLWRAPVPDKKQSRPRDN